MKNMHVTIFPLSLCLRVALIESPLTPPFGRLAHSALCISTRSPQNSWIYFHSFLILITCSPFIYFHQLSMNVKWVTTLHSWKTNHYTLAVPTKDISTIFFIRHDTDLPHDKKNTVVLQLSSKVAVCP